MKISPTHLETDLIVLVLQALILYMRYSKISRLRGIFSRRHHVVMWLAHSLIFHNILDQDITTTLVAEYVLSN